MYRISNYVGAPRWTWHWWSTPYSVRIWWGTVLLSGKGSTTFRTLEVWDNYKNSNIRNATKTATATATSCKTWKSAWASTGKKLNSQLMVLVYYRILGLLSSLGESCVACNPSTANKTAPLLLSHGQATTSSRISPSIQWTINANSSKSLMSLFPSSKCDHPYQWNATKAPELMRNTVFVAIQRWSWGSMCKNTCVFCM